jgi:hypothetical protein
MAIDITGPKVLTPAILFALLSPGLLVSLPLPIAAVLLAIVYFVIARFVLQVTLKPTDLIVPAVLFLLLTPGVLLTIPPGSRGVFMSGQTSVAAIAVHALVFALVFSTLRGQFPQYY